MEDKYLSYLKKNYIWGLAMYVIGLAVSFHPTLQNLLVIGGCTPLLLLHIWLSIKEVAWKQKRLFALLSLLWLIEYGLSVYLVIKSILKDRSIALIWPTMFFFGVILFAISLSLILNRPFFYKKTPQSKSMMIFGIILMIVCLLYFYENGRLFLSVYRFFGFRLV